VSQVRETYSSRPVFRMTSTNCCCEKTHGTPSPYGVPNTRYTIAIRCTKHTVHHHHTVYQTHGTPSPYGVPNTRYTIAIRCTKHTVHHRHTVYQTHGTPSPYGVPSTRYTIAIRCTKRTQSPTVPIGQSTQVK